ncbi:MAG: methylmalonyl-CoA mutase [Nitrospinota bacterium]
MVEMSIAGARAAWEENTLRESLRRMPERQESFETSSGIPLKRLYTPEDLEGMDYGRDLGYPGEFPFTRGAHPSMYRSRLWTMRQYAGFGSAAESNRRYHYLLAQGNMGLSVAFDLPTQMGYDSDHPLAAGEAGKAGVAVGSLEDMETLLRGIPLDRVSTSMTINATAAILLSLYVAVAEKQGVPPERLRGTVQNDILKEYIARGTYIYPPGPSLRLVTDLMAFCRERLPQWNPISVSGYHIREAGSTAVQELGFTLANALCYMRAAREAGLEPGEVGERVSFFFNVHNHFLEEVAKFRAARRLWAHLMRQRFGVENPRAQMLRFHAQTAGCSLTAQQPWNNVVRVAFQALAAVLGGAQSLHTNSMDEALALPSERAVELALRTQQLLAEESYAAETVDPLGGAYAVEALTNELERRALEYIERIEAMGGAVAAIEFMRREIQESAFRHQRAVEEGREVVVGVNRYQEGEKSPIPTLRVDPQVEEDQKRRLAALRARREAPAVEGALSRLQRAARGRENLLPLLLEAVKAYATLGEISDALREVFGTHRESVAF